MATAPNPYPISPFFSFRWVNENLLPTRKYQNLPLDSVSDDNSYWQQCQDTEKYQIQYTNIFVPTCKLYTCRDVFVKDIEMTPINPPLVNTDLICYNGEVDFLGEAEGNYYCKLTYTDENDIVQDWRTCILQFEHDIPGTVLYEVSNNTNEKGAIFLSPEPIVINFRVHAMLKNPVPKSDTEDYEDQYNDIEQLSSIPFDVVTDLIGNSIYNVSNFFQVPYWVIQKINLLYSLSNVLRDGQPFAKTSGAEFKPYRVDNQINEDAYWGIDIQPKSSYPNDQYETGTTPDEEYVVIYKKKTYLNVGADFSIAGVFTDDTNLIKIILFNNGGDAFTLKLGTTVGGNDIRQFDISASQLKNPLLVEYPFTGNTTLYLSGLTGTDCKIIVVYDDFLAANTPPPTPVTKWQKDILYLYVENTPGTFGNEFNVATGLGVVGSDHEGCKIADDYADLAISLWNRTDSASRGTVIGDNNINLTVGQLPVNNLILGKDRKGGNAGSDILSALTPGPFGQNSYNVGGNGDPINIQNEARVTVGFYYIG